MEQASAMKRVSLDAFERHHASKRVHKLERPTVRELMCTVALALTMAPFTLVTFAVIPVMGQVTVLLSASLTVLYIYYRRSVLVACAAIGSSLFFWALLFMTIQGIKNNLEVALFFFTALGIPVSFLYSIFVASRIWMVRGGIEE